jgi:hypothetical protein
MSIFKRHRFPVEIIMLSFRNRHCCINSVGRIVATARLDQAALVKMLNSLLMKCTSSSTCGLHMRQWPRRIIRITSKPLIVADAVFISVI